MRILVTGGSGLVGSALQRKGGNSDSLFFASSSDGDLRDKHAVHALFERVRPSAVIHLAARVGGLFANILNPVSFFEDNLLINLNVVHACGLFRVRNAVFCLSTCIFPAHVNLPLSESDIHQGPPDESNEAYAYAKRMLECHVRYYVRTHGFTWCCVIPTNIYGPNDNFSLSDGHVVPALIHKFFDAVREGSGTVFVSGTGRPIRQFIFSEDLADVILRMLREGLCGNYICCNPDEEVRISALAHMIGTQIGFSGEIVFDETRPDGVFSKSASCQKLKDAIGEIAFTSLNDGLRKTIDWFVANHHTCTVRL